MSNAIHIYFIWTDELASIFVSKMVGIMTFRPKLI